MSKVPKTSKAKTRKEVFIPAVGIMLILGIIGIFWNEALRDGARTLFRFSLTNFGWLFQLTMTASVLLVIACFFPRIGNIRLGGKSAKPKYSFPTWFAMSLTGGIAVGIVNWGINEPMVHMASVWGELNGLGIEPNTMEAARFSMARVFYHWTIFPYATYAICGLLAAYVYYNRRKDSDLTVTATLEPLLGERITKNTAVSGLINTLSILAIAFGITGGLGTGLNLVLQGMRINYGADPGNLFLWLGIGFVVLIIVSLSSYTGLDRGIKRMANFNKYVFYALIALIIIVGPTLSQLNFMMEGLSEFFRNIVPWSFDPGTMTDPAQGHTWTLTNWAIWIAYAPITGLFFAKIAYGRTVRQFLIINWLLPSLFGVVWFSVFGGTALRWQLDGTVDLASYVANYGAVASAWAFFQNLPFGLNTVVAPLVMITLLLSFSTAADGMTNTMAQLSTKGLALGEEPPAFKKIIWVVLVLGMAILLGATAGGHTGIDGLRAMMNAGGFIILFLFALQIVAFVKVLFFQKPTDDFEPIGEKYTEKELEELNQ